ncbi:zinc finger protein ZFP2-like [Ruditapes philippinarum]|uniref:zinc finger protein ZFP2-like n=1 Tax=Ruditapes philippinarum TaxID=129788 RepID=UPI00295B260E|nr:zinc finger protein ZFP2-like [Ruditapes philippinarum]
MEEGRKVTEEIKYKCGGCLFICTTILDLHFHLIEHIEGGNYFFNNALKTAYPKHKNRDADCQTSEKNILLINNIKQEFVEESENIETVSTATQTEDHASNQDENVDTIDDDKSEDTRCSLKFGKLQDEEEKDTLQSAQYSDDFDGEESNEEAVYDEKLVKVEEAVDYTKLISVRKRKASGSHKQRKKKKKTVKKRACKKNKTVLKETETLDADKGENTSEETEQLKQESDHDSDKPFDDTVTPERKMFSCSVCNKQIGSRQAWEIHIEHLHYHVYPCQCEMCYFPCQDQDELAVHNCSLASSEYHECIQCPDKKHFKYRCNLVAHIEVVHDQNYPLKCETCDLSLISELEKRKHMTKHDPSLLVCGYCNKKMRTIGELESHLPNHTGETRFHCHICDKKYRKKAYLRDHIFRIHSSEEEKQCICEKCGSSFAHSKVLYDHRRSSCGEPIYECDLCDKKFCQKTSLKYHIRNHTGERPFICDFCGDSFMYRNTLSSHIKHRHTNDRQFKCSMCEKSFVKLCTLQRHERVHLKIKMFSCEYCKKEFSTNWNLKAHMRQHTGATPYTCSSCGLGFAHNVVRKTHEAKCKGVTFS